MNLWMILGIAASGVPAILSASAFAGGVPTYNVIVVSPPAPYSAIEARKVNDVGHFVGLAGNATSGTYVFWSPENGVVPLRPPAGEIVSAAGINASDQVPIATTIGPYLWSPKGGWVPIKNLASAAHTQPTAINNRGQIIGFAFDGDGQDGDRTRRGVKWRANGEILEIRPNTEMIPRTINEHQEILSTVFRGEDGFLISYQAELIKHLGDSVKLGDLPDNGNKPRSLAVGLSENGFAAVNSPESDLNDFVACYWNENRGMRSLGLGPSTAVGMSRRGTIAGVAQQGSAGPYSFAWNLQWDGAIDVSEHFTPGSPRFDLLQAYGISGNGTIAAAGFIQSIRNAVVLMPID
jgi:hypothetical protein